MTTAPIILVPGFWLGAWAWDEVAARLRADGHDVTALTLPGLESVDTDRSAITFSDHVDAIGVVVRALGILPGLTHYNICASPLFAAVTLDFLDRQPAQG
jgi:pimeloyl-ACP methyl ester carboxylesterase